MLFRSLLLRNVTKREHVTAILKAPENAEEIAKWGPEWQQLMREIAQQVLAKFPKPAAEPEAAAA